MVEFQPTIGEWWIAGEPASAVPGFSWWWRRIAESLDQDQGDDQSQSELVIYWWSSATPVPTRDAVIDRFLHGAGIGSHDAIGQRVRDRIHVVVYTDQSPPVWLATP